MNNQYFWAVPLDPTFGVCSLVSIYGPTCFIKVEYYTLDLVKGESTVRSAPNHGGIGQ